MKWEMTLSVSEMFGKTLIPNWFIPLLAGWFAWRVSRNRFPGAAIVCINLIVACVLW